ncbi:MAG: hypothetical protein ABIQ35_14125 [Verrucomicrobiota bacterium]
MKIYKIKALLLALIVPLFFISGCDSGNEVPVPLPLNELAATMDKAFSKAKTGTKSLATQVVSAVQAKDYSKAFLDLQALIGAPDLTKQQANVAGRALLTVNSLMQTAETQGDAKSAETMRIYRQNK